MVKKEFTLYDRSPKRSLITGLHADSRQHKVKMLPFSQGGSLLQKPKCRNSLSEHFANIGNDFLLSKYDTTYFCKYLMPDKHYRNGFVCQIPFIC